MQCDKYSNLGRYNSEFIPLVTAKNEYVLLLISCVLNTLTETH